MFFDELRGGAIGISWKSQRFAQVGVHTSFLKASSFVRRAISCSAEVVFGSSNMTALPFPLSLRSYEFNK
jgi:hypothetical protein